MSNPFSNLPEPPERPSTWLRETVLGTYSNFLVVFRMIDLYVGKLPTSVGSVLKIMEEPDQEQDIAYDKAQKKEPDKLV